MVFDSIICLISRVFGRNSPVLTPTQDEQVARDKEFRLLTNEQLLNLIVLDLVSVEQIQVIATVARERIDVELADLVELCESRLG